MINRILLALPHKHWLLTKEGVGEMFVCNSLNRILEINWRKDADSPWFSVPVNKAMDIAAADSWEEVNAMLLLHQMES